jgi:hypothetical protein
MALGLKELKQERPPPRARQLLSNNYLRARLDVCPGVSFGSFMAALLHFSPTQQHQHLK